MKRLYAAILPWLLAMSMAVLLFQGGVAQASSAQTCGKWSIVASQNNSNYTFLYGVAATSATDVWSVGYARGSIIEHWDGTQWSIVPGPRPAGNESGLHGVTAISASDIWAVGYNANTITEHWNGNGWKLFPSPNPQNAFTSDLLSVASDATNDVWAAGYFANANENEYSNTLIEHWDGTQWSVVPSPNVGSIYNVLRSVAAVSPTDVWAVGSTFYPDGPVNTSAPLVEHWDGTQWSVVSSPNPGFAYLNGVTAISANDIWAVGSANGHALAEHWNGTQWSVVPAHSATGNLNAVTAIATNNVWAAGTKALGGGGLQTLTEHWNGTKWQVVSSPNQPGDFNELFSIAAAGQDIWTVGEYGTSHGDNSLTEVYC